MSVEFMLEGIVQGSRVQQPNDKKKSEFSIYRFLDDSRIEEPEMVTVLDFTGSPLIPRGQKARFPVRARIDKKGEISWTRADLPEAEKKGAKNDAGRGASLI